MFDIQEELKKLPHSPGVYLHHDARDEIIYIGKAKNLKNRVSQRSVEHTSELQSRI